jgi:hypothetical protein
VKAAALVILLLLAASPAFAECPLDLGRGTGMVVFSEHFIIAVRPEPLRFEVGDTFALILNVCTGVDAQLDEKNVINQAPNIVAGKDGRYRVNDLVLTAPGSWEIGFNVREGKDVERLTHDIVVK